MPRSVGLLQTIAVSVGVAIGSGHLPRPRHRRLPAAGARRHPRVLGARRHHCSVRRASRWRSWPARCRARGYIRLPARRRYGPLPAFLFGWTELVVIRAAALGAIATIFAEYLGYFWPLSSQQVRYVAALAIVLIGAINYLGVQRAAVLQSITTALKYGALLALGLLAFTASGGSGAHFTPAWGGGISLSLAGDGPDSGALDLADGWADPATMAGEISGSAAQPAPCADRRGAVRHVGLTSSSTSASCTALARRADGGLEAHRRQRCRAHPAAGGTRGPA